MKLLMNFSRQLFKTYQVALETRIRGSDFVFDSIQLLYYKCHKITFKRGETYIDSPDWIKKKKATINPKTDDDKCFQNATRTTLNFEKIEKDPQKNLNIIAFINNYDWEGINHPSKIEDSKRFEKNNPANALNILYIKEKEVCIAYISKINSNWEKQIILSMISNVEKECWHYLAVKNYLHY